jgi:lysophospholipase L1-like esterase
VGCYNNAHIVAESPALSGLTDADLSNWSCSVHEAFQTWSSGLIPLAIAKDFDSSYTASDGKQGPPYILAGGDIRSFPLSITPLNDSATAGGPHTVTAQLLDGATLSPLVGAKIGFQVVAGPNAGVTGVCSNASCVTGTDGNVSWTYTSNGSSGSDTIEAFYDMNKNGTADVGEPQTTAGMQWTAAPAKALVGLGDSIAAGHGLGPSVGFPDNADAYPLQLAKQLGYGGYDYAISGACVASPNKDGGSSSTPSSCTTSVLSDELPAIGVKPNVITLTVGANDISFGDCFKAVVLKVGTNPCSGSTFNSNLGALSKNLSTLYAVIKQKYPGIPIYEMLYYNPLPLAPSSTSQICPASRVIAGIDKKSNLGYIQSLYLGATGQFDADAATVQGNLFVTAQQIINKLNSTIKNAATAAGVTTVAQDFTGHDFCQTLTGGSVADTWVYGPTFHGFFEAFSVVTDKKFPFDIDAPSACPAPHTGDATQYYTSGTGGWDGVAYTYAFTFTINCLPHPTIDGQRAIAAAFKTKITP